MSAKEIRRRKRRSVIFVCAFLLLVLAASFFIIKNANDLLAPRDMPKVIDTQLSASIDDRPDTKDYQTIVKKTSEIHQGQLILVGKNNPYLFPKQNLASVYQAKSASYAVKDMTVLLDESVIPELNRMLDDFKSSQDVDDVLLLSGYRSKEDQQRVYGVKQDETGEAEKWASEPGKSEHHTGLAFDFSLNRGFGANREYTGKGKYRWISENACRYGFILRYPEEKSKVTGISYEPWHFRYVGKPHAYLMARKGICLEEYIECIQTYRFGEKHLSVLDDEKHRYEIYYVKASGETTQIPVPKTHPYTISGDNDGGFIVTVSFDDKQS